MDRYDVLTPEIDGLIGVGIFALGVGFLLGIRYERKVKDIHYLDPISRP
jgi:hypothetical protein